MNGKKKGGTGMGEKNEMVVNVERLEVIEQKITRAHPFP